METPMPAVPAQQTQKVAKVVGFVRMSKSGKSVSLKLVEDVKKGTYVNVSLSALQNILNAGVGSDQFAKASIFE